MRSGFISLTLLFFALLPAESFARRGRFFSHQGNFKGFNPCGWNSCRPHRSFRPFGGIFRRFGSRGPFSQMRNGFRRSPMMATPMPAPSIPQQAPRATPPHPDLRAQRQLQTPPEDEDLTPAPGFGEEEKKESIDRVKEGAQIFQARCQKCHSDGGSEGPIKDFGLAIERVKNGEMPADKTPRITGEEFENLKAFLETKK